MTGIHGARSFNSIRSRAVEVEIGEERVQVAALADIIAIKRAANRPRDDAVLDVLEKPLAKKKPAVHNRPGRKCSRLSGCKANSILRTRSAVCPPNP
jgi:hypothetical protein